MTTHQSQAHRLAALLLTCLAAPALAAGPAAEVVAVKRSGVPSDPTDRAWAEAPVFTAALIPQDMVEPRLLEPSTDAVQVRAISDGTRVAFRLQWTDQSADDLPGTTRFTDACAVQVPASVQADLPAPQMGEASRPVEITYWRAAWQAAVEGREDSIASLYPNAAVDHYPFEAAALKPGSEAQRDMAARYAPARAVGNTMAGPRKQPVEDLVAEGPGTIRPAPKQRAEGRGVREQNGWSVVIVRPLPAGLKPGARTQVAFAVWQGASGEAGARKMRSVWTPLLLQGK